LKVLERYGFIARLESPSMRRQVHYELTPHGQSLVGLIGTIDRWSTRGHGAPEGRGNKPGQPPGSSADPPKTPTQTDGAGKRDARADREEVEGAFEVDLQLGFVTVAVHNLDASARAFASAFGMPVPEFLDARIAVPPDQTAVLRLCWFAFQSFRVGVAQPLEGPTPHRAFLDRFGEGIHHLGFSTTENLAQVIARLQQEGGTWTIGGPGVPYAQMDFRAQLGAALGISQPWTAAQARMRSVDASVGPEALARHRLTNIGIVVHDLEEARRAYGEVLGLGVSQIKTVDLSLPGVSIVSHGSARIAYLKQHGVALKLIEPQGPGPLQDFLDRYGNRAHHIGFEVGHHFPRAVARLEALGGTVILGRRELGYALVDLTKQLGVVLELSGAPG
jgi:catechol 2,3-dioxygenase-like lactoylglutathione lyase family enzyme